jgi:hypothetical protein
MLHFKKQKEVFCFSFLLSILAAVSLSLFILFLDIEEICGREEENMEIND